MCKHIYVNNIANSAYIKVSDKGHSAEPEPAVRDDQRDLPLKLRDINRKIGRREEGDSRAVADSGERGASVARAKSAYAREWAV